MAEYRFEIWSTLPSEDPSTHSSHWTEISPFYFDDNDEADVYNFAGYDFTLGVADNITATYVGRGHAFSEDWMMDNTASRLFYLDNGKWVRV